MTWTCGKCPAKVRKEAMNCCFVLGETGWLLPANADASACPYSLAEMEAMQAKYLCMYGYPCDYLAAAITARREAGE